MKQMIVAHRGAKGLVPHENTIEAFQKAIDVGADCIEIDIRKTKDGIIVVFHDESIDGKSLTDLTYQDFINITTQKGYKAPTFEATLKFVKGKILLDVELKETGYEKEVIDLTHKYLSNDEFFVRSFYDEAILAIKNYDNKVKASLLLGKDKAKNLLFVRLSEIFPYFRLKKCKADFVSPHYRLLILGYIWRMKLINKPVSVWTVDDPKLIKKLLIRKKVWNVVTNFPNLGVEILKKN